MKYYQRALASVTRKKGKSLILFGVIFMLGNVIAGAIAIQQATSNVEDEIKSAIDVKATLRVDYDKLMAVDDENFDYNILKANDKETIETIATLPQVAYADYVISDFQESKNIKGTQEGSPGYIRFMGSSQTEIGDAEKGLIDISQGRTFDSNEIADGKKVALISENMAKLNNLKVGDTMVVEQYQNFSYYLDEEGSEIFGEDDSITVNLPLEIIGIFNIVDRAAPGAEGEEDPTQQMQQEDLETSVYVPNVLMEARIKEIAEATMEKGEQYFEVVYGDQTIEELVNNSLRGQAYYVLNSPEDAETFRADASAYLSPYDQVVLSTDQYDDVAGPLNQMSKIATLVLWVAVVASIAIISLVIVLFLRDRKHELGIYLSMGEKKSRVIGQIVIEVTLIAFVAISAAVISGHFVAQGVSDSMIQTSLAQTNEMGYMGGNYDYDIASLGVDILSQDDVLDAYDVSISGQFIIVFYLVALVTVLASTIIPLLYIVRLNPKKILM